MDLGGFGDVDVAGVPIPQGFAPDVGAHEFVTGPLASLTAEPFDTEPPTEPPIETPGATFPANESPPAGTTPDPFTPAPPTAEPSDPAPTPTPRVTPPPQPRQSPNANVPPPTGGSGALDQIIVLAAVLGVGGLLAAVFVARRSPV
jgi:hypothetical protein